MRLRTLVPGGDRDRKRIVALALDSGGAPAERFLEELFQKRKKDYGRTLALLSVYQKHGEVPEGKSKPITDYAGIFELRPTSQVRILYFNLPGEIVVLVDGIIKRTDKDRRLRQKYKQAEKIRESFLREMEREKRGT